MTAPAEPGGAREERKRFSSLARDMGVILLSVFVVLGLFALQNFLGRTQDGLKGNILTGAQLLIDSPGAQPPQPGIVFNASAYTPPKKLPSPQPHFQCLMKGGVTTDDFAIGGEIFHAVPCPDYAKKEEVKAEVKDRCLMVHVGDKLDNSVCVDEDKRVMFGLDVPVHGGGAAELIAPHSYNGLLFFLFFLTSMFTVWQRFEMRERKLGEREKQRAHQRMILPDEQVEVKMIMSAPLFKEIVPEEEKLLKPDEVEKVHERLMREQKEAMEAPALSPDEVNTSIKTFNEVGKRIARYLREGKLHKARRRYLLLFPLYTRLYHSVDETSRRELVEVIKYLHDQLNIMEKSRNIRHLIEEVYRNVEHHRVDQDHVQHAEKIFMHLGKEDREEKSPPLEKSKVMGEIERMRERLDEKDINDAQKEAAGRLRDELDELERLVYLGETKKKRKQKA